MALAGKAEAILERLEAAAPQEGLDIVSVEVTGPGDHPIIRVRIDTLDDEPIDMQGVVDHTPWVSGIVEDLDPFPDAYELEVSSPGLDRPLRRARDFGRFVGSRAEASLTQMVGGRMKGTGTIESVDGELVTMSVDGNPWTFDISQLRTARLKPDYAQIFAQAKAREPRDDGNRPAASDEGERGDDDQGDEA
jgi:ribosome maturation factor RimP